MRLFRILKKDQRTLFGGLAWYSQGVFIKYFFPIYFYICLIGSLFILPSATSRKYSINNVHNYYKNVNNFINLIDLKYDHLIKWLNNEIDRFDRDENQKFFIKKLVLLYYVFRNKSTHLI